MAKILKFPDKQPTRVYEGEEIEKEVSLIQSTLSHYRLNRIKEALKKIDKLTEQLKNINKDKE